MGDPIAEAVRVAERMLDHQLASLLAEREDLERLMRLGVAAMGGTLAATGLLVQNHATFPGVLAVFLATGVLAQGAATALASVAGSPAEVSVGPRIADLFSQMEQEVGLAQVRLALLDQATAAERHNEEVLAEATLRRRRAGVLLFLGTGIVFLALSFVVGGAILD